MTGLEVAVRFIHLASVLLLVGSFSFELLVGRPSLRTAGANAPIFFQSFYRLQFRVTRWSVLLAIVTGVLGLLIKIAAATGSASSESFAVGTVMNFVTGTRFGTIWIVRMALLSLILAVLLGWPKSASTRPRIGQLFLSTALLVSMDGLHLLAS